MALTGQRHPRQVLGAAGGHRVAGGGLAPKQNTTPPPEGKGWCLVPGYRTRWQPEGQWF